LLIAELPGGDLRTDRPMRFSKQRELPLDEQLATALQRGSDARRRTRRAKAPGSPALSLRDLEAAFSDGVPTNRRRARRADGPIDDPFAG
jgi:hypothetical protein